MAIHIKASHKGRLHRALGVPEGEPIPASKIAAAKHSPLAAVRKEATFADNAKDWHHGGSKHMGKAGHMAKAHEHVMAAHRQHNMSSAREHLAMAADHLKKAGANTKKHDAAERHSQIGGYDFRTDPRNK